MNKILILFIILIIVISCIIFNRCSNFENDFNKTPYPIDIVYTWAGENNNKHNIRESYNNELMYSLRSIFKYMPWFNKIYIVINTPVENNRPSWFNNLYHNRIILLDQKVIFPKTEHHKLPCKVTDIIESYINNIPGLSEHYIYMNDDFIINKELTYKYFFDNNKILLPTSVKRNKKLNFNNNLKLKKYPYCHINEAWHPHIPYAFTKTSYDNFLNEYKDWISWIRNSSFARRESNDNCKKYGLYLPCKQLHYPYRIHLYKNKLGKISKGLYETYISGDSNILINIQLFLYSKIFNCPFFVVNDIKNKNKNKITKFLQNKFSKKLYFEKINKYYY